jgi:hypothetical protein
MLGVPDAKAAEGFDRARTRRFVLQHQRKRQRGFDDEADLAGMMAFAVGNRTLDPIQNVRRKCASRSVVFGDQVAPESKALLRRGAHGRR